MMKKGSKKQIGFGESTLGRGLKRGLLISAACAFALLIRLADTHAERLNGENACSAPMQKANESASIEELRALIEEIIEKIDLDEWNEYLNESRAEALELLHQDASSAADLISEIAGVGVDAEPGSIFDLLVSAFIPKLKENIPLISIILVIAVFGGLAGMLFKDDGMDAPVKLALFSAAALSSTAAFSTLASTANDAISTICGFSEICAPPLAILLTACGCPESAAVLTPKLSLFASWISSLISGAVMPSLIISGILCVIGGVSEKLKLVGAVKLIHKLVKWVMGLATVIFGAVIIIGGSSAATLDGALFKGTKYAVDKLLPFGGGMLTGTVETVASGTLIVKNAVGTGGIIIAVLLIASPLLKLAGGVFAFRIASAVCELFSNDARIKYMLDGIADTLSSIFAVCACSAAMPVLILGTAISAGSAFL